ncbi:MAG: four helix bundle protein [candidate division WOR-3 bacterium]|nr:MAG: four helix bundle protein [candidate division WOR-3 bacterium]
MSKIKSFKDLIVWQVASELAKDIATRLVRMLPRTEKYRLGDQIIRSSRSVASQISEGFRKSSLREKNRFYGIAATSNDETENHLIEARNNAYINDKIFKHYLNRIIRVRVLLSRLMKSIRSLQNTARSALPRRKAAKTLHRR